MRALLTILIISSSFTTGCGIMWDKYNEFADQASTVLCDTSITNDYGGGEGTLAKPYYLCSLDHWNHFSATSADWDKYIQLEGDVDFTGVVLGTFNSVGTVGTPFTGHIDGNGFKFKNLTLTGTTEDLALIIQADGSPTFSNLTIDNINITSTGRVSGLILDYGGSGGSIAFNNFTVSNITLNDFGANVGGVIGRADDPVSVTDLTMSDISLNSNNSQRWGGFMGMSTATITMSQVVGSNISLVGSSNYAGGLFSEAYTADVSLSDVAIDNLTVSNSPGFNPSGLFFLAQGNVDLVRVNVTNANVYGVGFGGGLMGSTITGGSVDHVNVSESSFSGTIILSGGAGGLVGDANVNNINIEKSFFKGSISTGAGSMAGIIQNARNAAAVISDSYVEANIAQTNPFAGGSALGGLAIGGTDITFNRVYFSGALTRANGGTPLRCISNATPTAANDVYYDSTLCTAAHSAAGAIPGVTGLATGAFQTATPFTNWLPAVWNFTSGQNPRLQ